MILALMVAYLLGTFPTADLVNRLATRGAVDLRTAGSGNPGATNVAALLGARWGAAVLLGDVAKAVLATAAGRRVSGDVACWAGTAAVVGHCLPVWTRFRGGKGVACSAGQCLATFPVYFPIDLAVAYLAARWKHRAMAATRGASVCWIAAAVVWWLTGWANAWGPSPTPALAASAALSSAVIMWRFVTAARTGVRR